jgi:uncharacterized protein (DUF427 family)
MKAKGRILLNRIRPFAFYIATQHVAELDRHAELVETSLPLANYWPREAVEMLRLRPAGRFMYNKRQHARFLDKLGITF